MGTTTAIVAPRGGLARAPAGRSQTLLARLPSTKVFNKPGWLNRDTVVALIFALKTYGASLLALLIAFWLGLDEPRWAFLTVFVVSQPDSGLVLAKSFYRILGTIAGILVSTALVFAFAQSGELFVAALALWICFCNFAAQAERNFASYGFQLAGYTVAIVGIPAALNPSGAWPLIVARGTELMLGMFCAVLVSRLVLIRELSPKLLEAVRSLADRADRYATSLLDSDTDPKRVAAERTGLVEQYLQIEGLENSAYFESADSRMLDQRLRGLAYSAMQLCATADAVATHRFGVLLQFSGKPIETELPNANGSSQNSNAVPAAAMLRAADEREIVAARARLREAVAAFERGETPAAQQTKYERWSDPVSAMIIGVRSALAVGITAAIWFATAWPNGPAAVVVAAVLCSLLASLPNPDKLSLAAAAVVIVAAVLSFATQFYLLPLSVDFLSMAVALAPIILTCGFIMAQPKIGSLGLVAIVYFAFSSNIENVMTYDAAATLNASMSVLVGIGVALVLFTTFFPDTPSFATRRFYRQLLAHLRGLTNARSWATALRGYQLALYEQLATTLARLEDAPSAARDCRASAEAALSIAQAIGRLLGSLDSGKLDPKLMRQVARLLARLSDALRRPSVRKLGAIEQDTRLLTQAAGRDTIEFDARAPIVIACESLAADLLRARMLLQEKTNAR
jgi:uncharacterized membrane protein YccC